MAESNIASDSGSGSDRKRSEKSDESVHLEVQSMYPDDYDSDDDKDDLVDVEEGHYRTAVWFITDEIDPRTIIKKPSFAKYVLLCFEKPSWRLDVAKVEDQVIRIHDKFANKAKKYLQDFQGYVTLSYDSIHLGSWQTKRFLKDGIKFKDPICIAAHFIDHNWKVRKWILMYTTDVAKKTLDLFRTACHRFGIGNKVSTILLPSDEIFDDKALESIRTFIDPPPLFQIHCCADFFQFMASDLHRSLGQSLFEDFSRFNGWPKDATSINWDIMLSEMRQFLDLADKQLFGKDPRYLQFSPPPLEDIKKMTTCWELTDCIYKVATVLFDGHYSTANVYFHLLAELKVMLKSESQNDDLRNLATQLMERLDKYLNHMFLVLATASVLDPRLKMKYIEFYCLKMNDGGGSSNTLAYLQDLYDRYASTQIPIDHEDEEDDSEEDDPRKERKEGQAKMHKEAYKEFVLFQEFLKFEGCSVQSQESAPELDSYLNERLVEWDSDFKVLEWWKEKSQKYPILSRVARDVLAIPISRATMNEAYVVGKREPPEFVLSMDPEVANAMLCSKNWLRL